MQVLQVGIHQKMSDRTRQDPQHQFLSTGPGGRTNKAKSLFAVALDDLTYEASNTANKATIIKETNTSSAMRSAGENGFPRQGRCIDPTRPLPRALRLPTRLNRKEY